MLNIKKIRPMNNSLVTTKENYTEQDVMQGGLISKAVGSLKEYQKVIAVGPMVRNIAVGDIVCINPRRYAKHKHQAGSLKDNVITDNPVIAYEFNVIELDHEQYLLLYDSDIDFVVEEAEEETPKSIIVPEQKLIL